MKIRSGKSLLMGLLILFLLSACSSYSPSRHYPHSSYSYQATAGYYYPNYVYYGAYRPGWFSAGPYFPGNYWVSGAMVYWPTYSSPYYYSNNYYGRYYPYSDAWFYPYSRHSRVGYGHYYRPYYGSYYGYGAGHGGWYRPSPGRPYYGGSHSYRPPGGQHNNPRPDPVVIPRGERGGRAPGAGYSDRVDESLRQRHQYQPERRSATVVVEREGMSRSVGVAPGNDGSQGMVVSNRNERKIQPSRLHPTAPVVPETRINSSPAITGPAVVAPATRAAVVAPEQRGFSNGGPAPRASGRGYSAPVSSQPNVPGSEPVYQHQRDPGSTVPRRAERPQQRNTERGPERDRERSRQ